MVWHLGASAPIVQLLCDRPSVISRWESMYAVHGPVTDASRRPAGLGTASVVSVDGSPRLVSTSCSDSGPWPEDRIDTGRAAATRGLRRAFAARSRAPAARAGGRRERDQAPWSDMDRRDVGGVGHRDPVERDAGAAGARRELLQTRRPRTAARGHERQERAGLRRRRARRGRGRDLHLARSGRGDGACAWGRRSRRQQHAREHGGAEQRHRHRRDATRPAHTPPARTAGDRW